MAFKEYSNPLYEDVADGDWLAGYCCIFANALRERFGLTIRALMVQSVADGAETLVHAFCVMGGGSMVDAHGVRPEAMVWQDYGHFTESDWRKIACCPDDEIKLFVRDVSLEELWELNPEDHEATNAAHEYIEAHAEKFRSLLPAMKAVQRSRPAFKR